ncbi:MAG: fimbrillin family protein [Rikenellaceae bacterium]|nr:fimbrillin family protein [Rikenellaceae bacterium]
MKKLFIVALAAFAMASCDRTDVVPTPEMGNDAIGFTTSTVNGSRATVTTDNLKTFFVQAIHNDTDHFMKFVRVDRQNNEDGSTSWIYNPVQYWPNSGTVDFYAMGAPLYNSTSESSYTTATFSLDLENNEPSVNTGKKSAVAKLQMYDSNKDGLYRAYTDYTYAVAMGESKKDEKVQLFFRHMMSQMAFQFKNTNEKLKVYVEDIRIENLINGGSYALPAKTTAKDDATARGGWYFEQAPFENSAIEKVTFDADINATSEEWIEVPGDGTLIPYTDVMATKQGETMFEDGIMNLIPHTVTPWDKENDPTNENDGVRFLLKVKYMNEDTCIWPRLEEGQTGADAGTDWVAVPFKFSKSGNTMKEGVRYIVTFVFGEGGGSDPDTGEDILKPIDFEVLVEEYVLDTEDPEGYPVVM